MRQPEINWHDKWSGVNQGGLPENIPIGMFAEALNYEIDTEGVLAPRQGYGLYATAAAPDGRPIRTIYSADFDGTLRIIVATDQHVYEFVPGPPQAWTLIYTITGGTKRMTFAMLNANTSPVLIFGNGYIHMQKWTGTGSTSDVGEESTGMAPHGRPITYKNYLAVFDIGASHSNPASPGIVQFSSNVGDPDKWTGGPSGSGIKRYIDLPGTVTGLFPFGGLVIFTDRKAMLFSGDPEAATGTSVLSETVGCACHETIVDAGGALVWLGQSGVMVWDGGGSFPTQNLSKPEDITASRCQRDIDAFVWGEITNAAAIYHPVKRYYMLSSKSLLGDGVSTSYWRTFVYNCKLNSWMPWTLESTAFATIIHPTKKRQMVIAGTAAGTIRIEDSGNFIDNGATSATDVTFPFFVKTGDISPAGPNAQAVIRAVYVGTTGMIGDQDITDRTVSVTVQTEFDRNTSAPGAIQTNAGGFTLGSFLHGQLGRDVLGSNHRYQESRVPFAVRGKHFNITVAGFSKACAVSIAQLGVEWYPLSKRKILVGEA